MKRRSNLDALLAVVDLYAPLGQDAAAIARELGTTPPAVRRHLRDARERGLELPTPANDVSRDR